MSLQEAEYAELASQLLNLTVTDNPFIPLHPTERQAVFLTEPVDEALYGGAAGGGKSVALLMAALQYVTEPGYDALLLRRTFADLNKPRALIPLSHEWLHGTRAQWNGNDYRWTFPSGATLSFGYLANQNDHLQYQGAAYSFVGWDELTQFPENQYRYLFSRKRKGAGLNFPTRFRATANPGGLGHEWVKSRFIAAADGIKRLFVPAKLDDNPYLDRDDYESSLNELDPVTRAQLRNGDWDVRPEGNLFKRAWFTFTDRVPELSHVIRRWDIAATSEEEADDPDWQAGVKMGRGRDGRYYILDVQRQRGTPQDVKRLVWSTAQKDGRDCGVRIEQEPGSSGKIVIADFRSLLEGFDFRGVRSTGDKITRARPLSAACESKQVVLVRGAWNETFLDELCAFPVVGHDDQVDAASGCYADLTGDPTAWTEEDWNVVFGKKKRKPETPMEILARLRQQHGA
jgi:predicted phage terminase large subunit-like protein